MRRDQVQKGMRVVRKEPFSPLTSSRGMRAGEVVLYPDGVLSSAHSKGQYYCCVLFDDSPQKAQEVSINQIFPEADETARCYNPVVIKTFS